MKVTTRKCDLCEMMDEEEAMTAVAMYHDETGQRWDICHKHLELVKEAGMKYQMFARERQEENAR